MTDARAHVSALSRDLSWLVGAAEQAGVTIPDRVGDTLESAFSYLSHPDEPPAKKAPAKKATP